MSWNIIGWGIIACLVVIFIVGPLIRVAARWLCWLAQKEERRGIPDLYSRWVGVWGGREYRINKVMVNDTVVVSSDPNNMGGFHMGIIQWRETVQRGRLVRID